MRIVTWNPQELEATKTYPRGFRKDIPYFPENSKYFCIPEFAKCYMLCTTKFPFGTVIQSFALPSTSLDEKLSEKSLRLWHGYYSKKMPYKVLTSMGLTIKDKHRWLHMKRFINITEEQDVMQFAIFGSKLTRLEIIQFLIHTTATCCRKFKCCKIILFSAIN